MREETLNQYLSNGVKNIGKGILKASMKNPGASMFIMQYMNTSKHANQLREQKEKEGTHIPAFLITSITNRCNLHCKGCYARANKTCFDQELDGSQKLLTADKWRDIFNEAANLGIAFILLAGGEPFVRRDVLKAAGDEKRILFPIFTNGTMLSSEYLELLSEKRNLVPVISIEGNQETTDNRRGEGVYQTLIHSMQELKKRGIIFGASVTVNKNNMKEVLADDFIQKLHNQGCKAIIYVEYVPMDSDSKKHAPDDDDREWMSEQMNQLRDSNPQMMLIAFPGDEKRSGGCLAAGRGFFHINATGGAEPCPFSPYSDTSLNDVSLLDALKSPLFTNLQINGNLLQEHTGGCVLFEQKEQVEQLLEECKE